MTVMLNPLTNNGNCSQTLTTETRLNEFLKGQGNEADVLGRRFQYGNAVLASNNRGQTELTRI
jgi:hypothetical protein